MAGPADNSILMRLAESSARVEEAVKGLRRDFEAMRDDFSDEKDHAHESRKEVHVQIGELATRTTELEGLVRIDGAISAQTRDVLDKTVMPVVAEFIAMKWKGAGMLSAAAMAGSILFWFLSTYAGKILALFKIGS